MAKGLNKHTPDSDELFKRLEQNDSSGLDDFEKEALEGFDSLDNVELAKDLNASLHKKIDERYFQKESGGNKRGMTYLSIAAGLVLIVGLSIFFMNIMGDKKEMAMEAAPSSEVVANEVTNPTDLAPTESEPKKETEENKSFGAAGGDATVTEALADKAKEITPGTKVPADEDRREKNQPENTDDGLKSRMVLKEKKTDANLDNTKTADSEGENYKKQEVDKLAMQGPPSGNVAASSPAVAEDQKASPVQPVTTKGKLDDNLAKNTNAPRNDLVMEKSGKSEGKKSEAPKKKARAKESGEALGNEDAVSAKDEANEQSVSQTSTVGGVATGTKRDESGYFHTVEYGNHAYYKPQDYIKVEINKSEMLKTNVKAFKAELTINEKGTVTAVKFLTTFDNCTGCKKELEKILLNMPGWKPKSKSAVETVSYIDN